MSTDQVYRFNFVTDPDDPTLSTSYDKLMKSIKDNNTILLTEEYLDRGLVRYNIDTIYDYDQTPDHINKMTELIGEIGYIPVTTSMKTDRFENNLGSVITGAEQIIKKLTEKLLKTDVINVESTRYDRNIVIFNPITEYNTAVYQNPSYLGEYHLTVNMDVLGGYQVLSDDPMVRYVLSKLYRDNEYLPTDINVIYVKNVALVPVGRNINEEEHYSDIIDAIDTIIRKRRSDGYFSYHISIHNLEDLGIIHELARLWDTKIVYDEDMIDIILQTNIDFGTRPEIWFGGNLSLIKLGYFPTITLYGSWQLYPGDYNQIFGKEFYDTLLHYGSLLAYRKMGDQDEFIRPFTHTVTVNNDLSITISVPTYDHVEMFKKYFDEILNGYKGLEHNGHNTWVVEPCTDLIEGVIKRWHVQTIDERAMPMVLTHVNEDGTKGEVLVFRSPVIGLYRTEHPFDFNNIDLEEVKKDLVSHLKEYYKVCHDNFEPVLRDKIDEMGLKDLLDLVEIRERPDHPTYCLSKDTILNLDHPINPITRRPFKDKILSKAMLMEWGLRGLFDVGPLKGLYDDIPEKIPVRPKVGTPIFNKIEVEPLLYDITGDIYNIEIEFEDGTISSLFEIAVSNISELEKVVKELWEKGYFLNYWVSAVQKYVPEIKSYSVIITNPRLLNAADSRSDGIRAMEYLKEMNV